MIISLGNGYFRLTSRFISSFWALTGGRYDKTAVETYTYTGANDQQWKFVKYTLSLSASKNWVAAGQTLQINPSNKALGISWSSSNTSAATVDGNGKVTGRAPGTATITAKAGGATATYTVTVRDSDPFHPDNIETIRAKKWLSSKTTDGITYENCDMTTVATKSIINKFWYFTVYFDDEDEVTTFQIDTSLINELNSLETEYQAQWIKSGRPQCFHEGKKYADIFVDEGKIAASSAEYYGIWAYNGNSICAIADRISLNYYLSSAAYSGLLYGFTSVMSLQSAQMSAGDTKVYTSNSYNNAVQSQKAISDIADDAAVQAGKTDTVSPTGLRRTWRGSEMRTAEDYTLQDGYGYNKSYKTVNGKLTEVSHGTAGSQRPDFYNPSTNHMVEVKNYTITTATGRNNLAKNIASQYNQRKELFPNAVIEFKVDVYGQAYTQTMLDDILNRVETLLGNSDMVKFMRK